MKAHIMDYGLFIDYLRHRNIKASTIKRYACVIKRYLVDNPDIDSIDSYNTYLIKVSVRKRTYAPYYVLRHFINYKLGLEGSKIIKELIKPKMLDNSKDTMPLTDNEVLRVLNALGDINEKHQVMAIIQFLTGARTGDVLKLKRENIYTETINEEEVLKINFWGKGDKKRPYFIWDHNMIDIILNWLNSNFQPRPFLKESKTIPYAQFSDEMTQLIDKNYSYYWRNIKLALSNCNIDKTRFSTHDLRRRYARTIWNRYHDVDTLKTLMGHSRVETSLRYLHNAGLNILEKSRELQLNCIRPVLS